MSSNSETMKKACEIEIKRSNNYLTYLSQNMTTEQLQQAKAMYEIKRKR